MRACQGYPQQQAYPNAHPADATPIAAPAVVAAPVSVMQAPMPTPMMVPQVSWKKIKDKSWKYARLLLMAEPCMLPS